MTAMPKVEDRDAQRKIEELCAAGQEQVFAHWEKLSPGERGELLAQVKDIDLQLLGTMIKQYTLGGAEAAAAQVYTPAPVIPLPSTKQETEEYARMVKAGEEKIRQGKVATFVVAGGQSSRLGYDSPKGMFGVGPVTGKSLFQYHAEKILALNAKYGAKIPWYIMTSQYNSAATKSFFEQNGYFGLDKRDVFFFEQGMLPSIDFKGKMILDAPNRIAMNPDGHGGVVRAFKKSGAIEDMKKGVEYLCYFQVDNVIVKVADPAFIGYHIAGGSEMSSKIVKKAGPEEKVGVIVNVNGKPLVVEYSDLSKEDMYAVNPDGSLKYWAGSIAIHMFNVSFLDRLTSRGGGLPYHIAKKKIRYIDAEGKTVEPSEPNGVKFEAFVFDALTEAEKSITMETSRLEEFSPLKNKTGADSVETVRRDLLNRYGSWLEAAGLKVKRDSSGNVSTVTEISPLYALDREEFMKKGVKHAGATENLYLK